MTPEVAMQLFGNGLYLTVLIVSLVVGPGLIVGLIVSMFQAATQINEQTLSFLPRLMVTLFMTVAISMNPSKDQRSPSSDETVSRLLVERNSSCFLRE